MGFYYRKPISGDAVIPAKDYTIASGVTVVPGDLVRLDSSGDIVQATSVSTNILGVAEGTDFVNGKAKVRISSDAVYQADVAGTGTLTIGVAYGITDDAEFDTDDVTGTIARIVEVVDGKPYVVITQRQMV
jgi:hypothetical protein